MDHVAKVGVSEFLAVEAETLQSRQLPIRRRSARLVFQSRLKSNLQHFHLNLRP